MKVSVCIPTYNQALYLEQAIRSAVQQTLLPSEIIVADDCSTDHTQELLQTLAAEMPILKVIRQPYNKGITENTNICLKLATGDFVVRLDSDDYLSEDYTLKLAELLQQHPQAAYAHAAVQEVDLNGKHLKLRKLARMPGYQESTEALRAATKGYRVAANILMFRKSALHSVGYLSAHIDFAEDYHLSVSLAAAGFGNVYLDETLSFYRVWIDKARTRKRRKVAEIAGLRSVFEDVLEPAYRERKWNINELKSRRSKFACEHADCLGWKVYSLEEKYELAAELRKLSSSYGVNFFIWLYMNGLGGVIGSGAKLLSFSKDLIKNLYFKYQTYSRIS